MELPFMEPKVSDTAWEREVQLNSSGGSFCALGVDPPGLHQDVGDLLRQASKYPCKHDEDS